MQAFCSTHPADPAVAGCPTCGRPFCARCRVEDLAHERFYCSEQCRDAPRASPGRAARPAAELIRELRTPIRAGWRLWARNALPLTLYVAVPVGAAYSTLRYLSLGPDPSDDGNSASHTLGVAVIGALAAAAVAVVLSRSHTGAPSGHPWRQVAARLLPWAAAWIVFGAACLLGSLLLIVPGIIAGIRLFWADEFTLIHGMGPIAALKESIRLTRGLTSRIFVFQFLLGLAQNLALVLLMLGFVVAGGTLSLMPPGIVATFAMGTLVSILLVHFYASAHAPEIVYFYGLRALRSELPSDALEGDWVARGLAVASSGGKDLERCSACGATWSPADYRSDAEAIFCSRCKEPLRRPVEMTA